jgi:DNA-binding HxlR family transcriptional regulator
MPQGAFGEKPRRQWAPDARALSVVGDRWLMVIVRDLAAGPLRLDELRRWLPGVSAGALEARLARMAEEGLIERRRFRSLPPRVDLELTDRGRDLLTALGELARWELRNFWSRPRGDEWVDVAACFRLSPFLAPAGPRHGNGAGHDAKDGEIALTIERGDVAAEQYAFIREAGRTKVEHRPAAGALAHLRGTQDAWIDALSPDGGAAALTIEGEHALAQRFLRLFDAP